MNVFFSRPVSTTAEGAGVFDGDNKGLRKPVRRRSISCLLREKRRCVSRLSVRCTLRELPLREVDEYRFRCSPRSDWCRQRAVAEEVKRSNPIMHGLGLQTEIQQLRRDLQAFLNEQEVSVYHGHHRTEFAFCSSRVPECVRVFQFHVLLVVSVITGLPFRPCLCVKPTTAELSRCKYIYIGPRSRRVRNTLLVSCIVGLYVSRRPAPAQAK